MKYLEKQFLFSTLLSLATYFGLTAQESLLFHNCSEGLSQSTVVSTTQDNQGFLWIATQHGLNRYDGYTHKHIDIYKGGINAVKSYQLTSLAYDKRNNELWIGSFGGGLTKINLDSYERHHYNASDHLVSDNFITDLYIDNDNLLWVSTEKAGICVLDLDDQDKHFSTSVFDVSQFSQNYTTSITGSGDLILMGTWASGLVILNKTTGVVKTMFDKNIPIRSVITGDHKDFYVGSNKGVKRLTVDSVGTIRDEDILPELNNTVILSLLVDSNSKLFIGTENEGLYTLQNGTLNKYVSNSSSLDHISGNSIWSIYEDKTGVIWIGLFLKGLNKIDRLENKFNKIQKFKCGTNQIELDLVSSIGETKHDLWIGTDGNGLYSYNKSTRKYKCHDFGPHDRLAVTTILEVEKDKLWLGTWKEGIIKYDLITEQYEFINTHQKGKEQLSGDFVVDLHQDKKGQTWVSCFETGIDVFSDNKRIKSFDSRYLLSTKVRVISENCTGQIILGTEASGIQLLTLDDDYNIIKTKGVIKSKDSNFSYAINDVKLDSSCNMWVATTKGMAYINESSEQLKLYTKKEGLPSNYIASLEFADNGLLWGTTNQGIFSFDIKNETTTCYTLEDGILSNEFLSNASTKTKRGDIYFGNNAGINYYTSSQILSNDLVPPVVITSITVSGKDLDSLETDYEYFAESNPTTYFDYKTNDLAFNFSSLNFSQSKLNQFKIRLKGLEKEWQNIGNRREIEYRNLQPGNYTFQVLGSNNDLLWNEEPAEFTFNIAKAWYNSLLAWLIYSLIFCLVVFFAVRNMIARFKLREELRIEHIENEKLKEISELRSQFFANISHELITPLTMIISPLKGIEDSQRELDPEHAKIMLSNAERLMTYINQILNLAKLESNTIKLNVRKYNFVEFLENTCTKFESIANSSGLDLKIMASVKSLALYYDAEKMEQVISNLLSNAIKYSKEKGHIIVKLTDELNEVVVEIIDDGVGIENKNIDKIFDRYFRENEDGFVSGIGIGLSIVKQLVDLHKGKISLSSRKDEFTIFKLTFQKGREHFTNILFNEPDLLYNQEELLSNDLIDNHISNDIGLETELPVILLVEDNMDIANYIRSYLKDSYHVFWAKDGEEGIKKATTRIPDVIISDVMMPKKNGYELCQELKSNELTSHISIILLTVKSSDDSQIKGYEYGADFYMTKPFTPQILKLRIDNIIKHNKEVAEKLQKARAQNQVILENKTSDLDQQFLDRFRDIVLENLSNSNFSVLDLASSLSYSKGQLYRKLKSVVNQSPNEFIRTVRLNQAARLLHESQYNISEITYKVGFNDLKYFRSCFKKQFGQTPSNYKSQKITT